MAHRRNHIQCAEEWHVLEGSHSFLPGKTVWYFNTCHLSAFEMSFVFKRYTNLCLLNFAHVYGRSPWISSAQSRQTDRCGVWGGDDVSGGVCRWSSRVAGSTWTAPRHTVRPVSPSSPSTAVTRASRSSRSGRHTSPSTSFSPTTSWNRSRAGRFRRVLSPGTLSYPRSCSRPTCSNTVVWSMCILWKFTTEWPKSLDPLKIAVAESTVYIIIYLLGKHIQQEIRSVEHGICPIAEFTTPWLNCAHSNSIPYPLFCW